MSTVRRTIFLVALAVFVAWGATGHVHAQESDRGEPNGSPGFVHVLDATITERDNSTFTVAATLHNTREEAVVLTPVLEIIDEERGRLTGYDVNSDAISIAPGKSTSVERSYSISGSLEGSYVPRFVAADSNGDRVAQRRLPSLTFSARKDPVEIMYDSCSFRSSGDSVSTPDVAAGDELVFSCEVKNSTDQDLTLRPVVTARHGTPFSTSTKQRAGTETSSLSAASTRTISAPISTDGSPGYYYIGVAYIDADGWLRTGYAYGVFRLRGIGARLTDVAAQHQRFSSGGELPVTVSWEADMQHATTATGTVTVAASVRDRRGNVCAPRVARRVSTEQAQETLTLELERACDGAVVSATVEDAGRVLDEMSTHYPADDGSFSLFSDTNLSTQLGVIGGVVVLVALVVTGLWIRRRKKSPKTHQNYYE